VCLTGFFIKDFQKSTLIDKEPFFIREIRVIRVKIFSGLSTLGDNDVKEKLFKNRPFLSRHV
jgi:hypothetical protein